jgi:hypothetical protein
MSSEDYVKAALIDVETELEKVGNRVPTKVSTPLAAGYRAELDQSLELDARRLTYYQGLVGVLRWICDIGRVYILVDTTKMSPYLASPREGHLQQVLHIFAYLKAHKRSTLVFDEMEPSYNPEWFTKRDWSEFYPGAT